MIEKSGSLGPQPGYVPAGEKATPRKRPEEKGNNAGTTSSNTVGVKLSEAKTPNQTSLVIKRGEAIGSLSRKARENGLVGKRVKVKQNDESFTIDNFSVEGNLGKEGSKIYVRSGMNYASTSGGPITLTIV